MTAITVSLGGKEYEVRPLPIRAAREWREQLRPMLDEVLNSLGTVQRIDFQGMTQRMEFGGVAALFEQLGPVLLRSPDTAAELAFRYSAVLEADRDFIEETATDEEMMTAFVSIVRLAYPLGALTTLLGPQSPGTSRSSRAPRGRPEPVAVS